MPSYEVSSPLKWGGVRHKVGAVIEMKAADAKPLVVAGILSVHVDLAAAEKAAAEKAAAEKAAAAEQQNTPASEAQAAGDQEEKAEGAGAPAAAGTAAQPAGKKKGTK